MMIGKQIELLLPVACWMLVSVAVLSAAYPAVEMAPSAAIAEATTKSWLAQEMAKIMELRSKTSTTTTTGAPTTTVGPITTTSTSATTTAVAIEPEITTDHRTPVAQRLVLDQADYITNDTEYAELLRRLGQEEEASSLSPRDYVADDASLEDILHLIEAAETNRRPEESAQTNTMVNYVNTEIFRGGSSETLEPETRPIDHETDETHGKDGKEDCPICMDNIANDESSIQLHCGHQYHVKCIRPWAWGDRSNAKLCPVCREEITRNDRDRLVHGF